MSAEVDSEPLIQDAREHRDQHVLQLVGRGAGIALNPRRMPQRGCQIIDGESE